MAPAFTTPGTGSIDKRRSQTARREAVASLGEVGPAARATVPALLDVLRDEGADILVRLEAVDALARISPRDVQPARSFLLALLRPGRYYRARPYSPLRVRAAAVLLEADLERGAALSALIRAVRDGEDRHGALKLSSDQRPGLRDASVYEPDERRAALAVLARLGREAEPAVPALLSLLKPDAPDVGPYEAGAIALTLFRVSPRDAGKALPALMRALGPDPESIRTGQRDSTGLAAVAAALGELGPEAKPAVPALLPLLDDWSREVRQAAADALNKIDPEAAARAGAR